MPEKTKLTKKQFDILVELADAKRILSQRELANKLGISTGSVNKIIGDFSKCGYICDNRITEQGLAALEPYKVKRAVFIAAGFGSRLMPITLNTPKPLVRVKGKRMIETTLDAIVNIGIEEIYVVRGYLGEQFEVLLHKYPTIKLIDNPDYNVANSIMSAVYAKDFFKNAYVLDSDLVLMNPSLITKYQYSSNYLGIPVEQTDDWCFNVKNGYVDSIALGGVNCYEWVGISYWSEEDGAKLADDLVSKILQPGGKEVFWDEVPLSSYKSHYKVYIRSCQKTDIIEIDSIRELKAVDKTYNVI